MTASGSLGQKGWKIKMKKWFSFSALLLVCLLLVACQSEKANAKDDQTSAQTVLATYLDTLKAGEFEAANAYLEMVPDNFKYSDNEVMKRFFAKMTYSVASVNQVSDGYEAVLELKLPNTAVIYDDMMSNIGEEVQKLQGGDDTSKSKASNMMIDYMLNKIDDANVVLAENKLNVMLKQVEGKWLIVPSDDLSKALSGLTLNAK